jgi:hypothetical protein
MWNFQSFLLSFQIRIKQNCPPGFGGQSNFLGCQSGYDRIWDHILKQDLESHGMSAALVGNEEFTVTIVGTIFKANMVIIIITVERKIKLVEEKALPLFRVPLCLFSFSDHSVVHV